MRQIALTAKKVRGIPRRLRALRKWADSFSGWFPKDLEESHRYCNWKIPVLNALVEGRQAQRQVQIECAQRLIDATGHLIAAKPAYADAFRVTCAICLPDMYSSEVCIYLQEAYFQGHVAEGMYQSSIVQAIKDRSLAQEWGLRLPDGVSERGVLVTYRDEGCNGDEDDHENDTPPVSEYWYFGEVHLHR